MILDEYNEMLIEQNHKCKICEIDELNAGKKGLSVDHNHENLQIRGLLCGSCNRAIGLFKENINTLEKAIEYLKDSNSKLLYLKSNIIDFKKVAESI